MFISIDFDGTVVDHCFPEIGRPAPGALYWLRAWQEAGAKLILFTVRSGDRLAPAVDFLESEGIGFYGINANPSQFSYSRSPKVRADFYIDDRGFGCPTVHPEGFHNPCVDWSIVGPAVMLEIAKEHPESDVSRFLTNASRLSARQGDMA